MRKQAISIQIFAGTMRCMTNLSRRCLPLILALILNGCVEKTPRAIAAPIKLAPASTHPVAKAALGRPTTLAAMEAVLETPGPVNVETVLSARWESMRSGLINLAHTRAVGLSDGPEPIAIYFHAVEHRGRGLYLIDTGVEHRLAASDNPLRTSAVGVAFNFPALRVESDLAAWRHDRPIAGVFLTHLHLDHVLGVADLPRDVPLFTGEGETTLESEDHNYSQPVVDGFLAGRGPIQEWKFDGENVIDVFGDGSFFCIKAPGHTPGSVAFVARTPKGAVLFTGDVSHTAWGWRNDVEPGTYSHDRPMSAKSLAFLRALAARHPAMSVKLGHQSL